jgi:ACS family hexuronate transporter-like MFS transporter
MKRVPGLRWWIVALISLGTILNYLARNSLGVLAPQLKLNLHVSTAQYSYVVAAFQLAYTVMQPVCGFVIDRIGLRLGVALFALIWAGANMLHAFAAGWPSLAVFRGLLGVGESAAVPSGVKAVSEWFPPRERSVAVGYFNTGTSLGALIAPPVVVFLALRYDWRAAFVIIGVLGAVWAMLWYIAYRPPTEHPLLGEAERAYILDGQPQSLPARTSMAAILRQRAFWAIAIPRFLSEPAWQTFSFWIPLYLTTERGMNLKGIALFAWLPFLAADIGGLAGGYLSPLLIKRFNVALIPSRIAGVVLGAVLMIGPGLVGLAAGPGWAIGLFCVGGFAHQMISTLINTLSADVFPASSIGTANGLVGMAGWTGGLIFTLIVGQLAERIGYSPLFACLALFDLIGAAVLIMLIRGVDAEPTGASA